MGCQIVLLILWVLLWNILLNNGFDEYDEADYCEINTFAQLMQAFPMNYNKQNNFLANKLCKNPKVVTALDNDLHGNRNCQCGKYIDQDS